MDGIVEDAGLSVFHVICALRDSRQVLIFAGSSDASPVILPYKDKVVRLLRFLTEDKSPEILSFNKDNIVNPVHFEMPEMSPVKASVYNTELIVTLSKKSDKEALLSDKSIRSERKVLA